MSCEFESCPGTVGAQCPCTGHCTTALGDDVCRSCHRTFEEVTRWLEFSDTERIQINRRILHKTGKNPISASQK